MLLPSKGFILITPQTSKAGFTLPKDTGNLRFGHVDAISEPIIHASGKELVAPVKVGTDVVFQYVENQDVTYEGKQYFLVPFNLIAGIISK